MEGGEKSWTLESLMRKSTVERNTKRQCEFVAEDHQWRGEIGWSQARANSARAFTR